MNFSGRLGDAFLALEETRRFALAAQRCHMSPSAFSQMIARLEDQIGARLFDRDTHNVRLTPEGEVFAHSAHRIAADMKSTLNEVRDRMQRRVGRVGIAAPPSLTAGEKLAFAAKHGVVNLITASSDRLRSESTFLWSPASRFIPS